MSRIFDAVQRGEDDDVSRVIASALDDTRNTPVESELDAQTLIGIALENLPAPDRPAGRAAAASAGFLNTDIDSAPEPPPKALAIALMRSRVRTVALTVTAKSPLLPFDTANWRASEQYRTIRTRILQHPRHPRVIALASAGAGDGKSVTAINVAGALSLKGEADVLLVDGDFRRSSLHTQMSLPLSPGLTDILLNRCTLEDALIRAEQFPNLYILPAGSRVENPSDLLERSPWTNLCAQISDTFRFTILDCPPIGAVSEWDLLQAACDGVVVIGRQDHTRLPALLQALESIPAEKLIGVVLNCVSDWLFVRANNAYDYPR